MRVLLTNDDGADSPGLAALAVAVKGWLEDRCLATNSSTAPEVLVVAPDTEHSGASASMGQLAQHTPIDYATSTLDGTIPVYALSTTPAACVILGCLGAFGEPPDLVLSGINLGANCGRSVLPSGTIGAALTAANYGVSALAVSQDAPAPDADMLWQVAAEMACEHIDWLLACPARSVASLNVPNLERDQIEGIRFAPPLAPLGVIVTQFDSRDDHRIYSKVTRAPGEVPPGSDRDLLLKGWATLSPLQRPSQDDSLPTPDSLAAPVPAKPEPADPHPAAPEPAQC